MSNLQKAIESIKLHQEPGHIPSDELVLATANKFGVEPDLIMLPFINEENARPIKSLALIPLNNFFLRKCFAISVGTSLPSLKA